MLGDSSQTISESLCSVCHLYNQLHAYGEATHSTAVLVNSNLLSSILAEMLNMFSVL